MTQRGPREWGGPYESCYSRLLLAPSPEAVFPSSIQAALYCQSSTVSVSLSFAHLLALSSLSLLKGKLPCWQSRAIIREESRVNLELNNWPNLCPPHLYLCPFCRTETCPSTPSTEFPPLLFKIQAEPRSRSCHSRDAHWDAGIGSHLSKGGYQKVPKVTWSKVQINWASYTETVTVDFKVPSTLRLYSHIVYASVSHLCPLGPSMLSPTARWQAKRKGRKLVLKEIVDSLSAFSKCCFKLLLCDLHNELILLKKMI